jgi:alpha-mannosidase
MKRSWALLSLCLFLTTAFSFSADTAQATASPDPYKPVLDRLESFTVVPVPDWRFHADVPHPEDPSLDDSSWEVVKPNEEWSTGSRVLRRTIEIPEKLNGYSLRGATVLLNLCFFARCDDCVTPPF